MRGADLEKEEVGVNHGPAEVALDVSHGLALDLEAVPHPQTTHDFVESSLEVGTEN